MLVYVLRVSMPVLAEIEPDNFTSRQLDFTKDYMSYLTSNQLKT